MSAEAPVKPRIVWAPLPGSQALALSCPCHRILYHGSRGPGKTDAQLMYFRKLVGCGYGRFWRGVIFDREYKNLDDLVEKSKRWFPQFGDGAKFHLSAKDYKWTWPTGEELLFRQGYKESDYDQYHGHEYPFIGFNELTKQPGRKFYDAIQSCNRSSFLPLEHSPDKTKPLPEIPLVVFSTTNPHGAGHNWVKLSIIDKGAPGVVQRVTSHIFNPRTKQKEDVIRTQTHIFGSYKENRYLAPEYIATLDAQTDPNKRKAWLEGDWDIVAGGALDDVWSRPVHVLPRSRVPSNWRVDRSMDWGSTHPFSVGWWAEANGEEMVLSDGRKFCPKKGTFIRVFEWYGTKEVGSNEGLKIGPVAIAKGIKEREKNLIDGCWIGANRNEKKQWVPAKTESDNPKEDIFTVWPGPADNQINNKNDDETETIAVRMAKNGVRWTESDKGKGSRINGLELVRERLRAALTGEGPAIYFMDCCQGTISTLPVLPRDVDNPDDVDTEAEDHAYDDVRYKVLSGNNRAALKIPTKYA